MRNKNVNYVRVQKGDMLLLVPTVRESGFLGLENEILWSLKEFNFNIFGYLDVKLVISHILKERALVGQAFYDIEMDMYDPQTYPDMMELSFRNRWDYAVMRQTYRYFDQLVKNFPEQTPTSFAISCGWNNNTRDVLAIYPLDDQNILNEGQDHLGIMFSSYTIYSETMIEDLIVKIGKCEKMQKDYEDFVPVKEEEKAVLSEHLIQKYNGFFLFKGGEIYCGMKWINPHILLKANWRLFVNEMIHPKGCKDCNTGYKMNICLPEDILKVFKHKLFKEYGLAGNDCYSVFVQLLNIINSQWKRIKKEMEDVEWIVFEKKYDDKRDVKGDYIVVQYLDKDWKGENVQEISFKHDGDYIVQDKEVIANAL